MSTPQSSEPRGSDLTAGFLLDGRWIVRPDINRIFDGEVEHQVPDKFMRVLVVLAASSGVVSRQQLFDAVWPDTLVVDESLTRAISSLRKLLGDNPKRSRIIDTIPKKGYRLLAPVKPLEREKDRHSPANGGAAQPMVALPNAGGSRWPILLAAAIAAVSVAGWWLTLRQATRAEVEPVRTQLTSLPGIEEYPSLSPAGDRVAFVWGGNDVEPDGVFVQAIGAAAPVRLTNVAGHYAFPTWSRDSRFIAYARVAGPSRGIFKVPATGGAEIELVVPEDEHTILITPEFSPDGRRLLYASRDTDGGMRLLETDLATGKTRVFAPSETIGFGGTRPRLSPDGRSLAFIPVDSLRRRVVIASTDGRIRHEIDNGELPLTDFDWAADDEHLVISGGGRVRVVGFDGSGVRIDSLTRSTGAISVARDTGTIAFSGGRQERNIWRWSPPTELAGEDRQRIIQSTTWDAFPSISPDGTTIAFLTTRTGTPQLWLASAEGDDAHLLAELSSLRWSPPAWSPDGRRLALTVEVGGTATTCLVDASNGKTTLLEPPDAGEVNPSWAADGRTLYVTRSTPDGGEIWRRSIASGDPAWVPIVTSGGARRAVEAPDGDGIYFTRLGLGSEIWRCGRDGSGAKPVLSLGGAEILTWQVSGRGLFVGTRTEVGDRTYRVSFVDIASGATTELFTTPGRLGFHLSIDPLDGRSIVYDVTEAVDADIFAVERP